MSRRALLEIALGVTGVAALLAFRLGFRHRAHLTETGKPRFAGRPEHRP